MARASGVIAVDRRLLAGAVSCLALGAMVVLAPSLSALVVPTMLGAIFVLALVQGLIQWPDETARRRLYQWSIVAFGAHLLFGLASTDISPHIRTYLGSDGFLYDATATKMVQHWTQGMPFPFVPHGKEGFYYLLAGLYWIFGSHTASGLAVNAALAAGLVPLLSDTTHRLFGSAAARYAGPLVVLMPGMFLWSSQLMKESGMLFLLAVALNSAVRLVERVSLTSLCVFTLSLALAFTFRAWVALMVAAGLLAGLVLGRKTLISGLGTGLTTGLVVATVMVASGLGYQGYQAAVSVDLQQATTVRKDLASTAGTGFQGDADISTTSGALTYLPQGMANFMLGPLPWNIRGARQLPFVPDMVVWWCLLPCLWTGYRRAGALVGRQRLVMVLPALATVLLLSLALANYGTVVRERLQVVVLIVPLIALGLSERAARRPEVETSTAGTTALALVGRA